MTSMIWSALILAVAGVAGLVFLVFYAVGLKAKLNHFGEEARLLGERVTQLQDVVDKIASKKRD